MVPVCASQPMTRPWIVGSRSSGIFGNHIAFPGTTMAAARIDFESNFRPLQIYEQVSEKIRAEIRSGRFLPDARLPSERELAALFGVGRPAVREAIGALQNEGLVMTKRNSGTYVVSTAAQLLASTPSVEMGEAGVASDFSPSATLDVRLILEPAIARRAAAHKKCDRLAEHYLSQMETLTDVADPEERALWNNSDRLFHRCNDGPVTLEAPERRWYLRPDSDSSLCCRTPADL
jgi:DNA-binding transcriptional regulator YhcF (GntR family)